MSPMKPAFSTRSVADRIDSFVEEKERKAVLTLSFIGERIVNLARESAPFTDRTGNLRSSIGYAIVMNGKPEKLVVKRAKKDDGGEGVKTGKALAKELGEKYNKGIVLIVFAGMEYAASVESKGYDVITGSVTTESALYRIMKRELGLS